MRIAFDATAIPANRAGAGIYIFNVVQALAKIDACNRYFVYARTEFIAEFGIAQSNVTFLSVDCESTLQRIFWEQTQLPATLARNGVQVLHSPHYTQPIRLPCRSIVTFHDMTFFTMPQVHGRFRRLFFQKMMRWSARHADRLITVSESTRQDLIRVLSPPPGRVVTIAEAASERFRRLDPPSVAAVCTRYELTPDRYVLFVGVLEPRKNLPALLEAFARIQADFPDVPLVVAGKKGWMYDAIFERTTALGLQDRVKFIGYAPEADLPALYNGARVFVYPSQYEGFGLPVLEALQCGTPVITSNLSSMPEVAGDAALLVAPEDIGSIAESIRRLLQDDGLTRELSQRGLDRARQFSWRRCAEETLDVYRSLGEV